MLTYFINEVKQLKRRQKQFLMIGADVLLLPFALWVALSLRLSNYWPIQYWIANSWILLLIPLISIPLFIHYGLYRAVLKYMGYQVIVATVKAVTLTSLCLGALLMFLSDIYFPRSTIMIFWFVSILVIISSRYIMKSILYLRELNMKPIGLYGAGEAGSQVIDNLRSSTEYLPVALFDDSPSKWGTVVNSMWVYSSDEMGDIIKKKNIKLILLAIIGITHQERRTILQKISKFPVEVRMIAGIDNLISGEFNLQQIQSVKVEDILGREPVEPNLKLLKKNINAKNVLVTGAGGSIGKELCRQIINLNPKKIVLYENNEFALYKAHLELKDLVSFVEVIPILSSIIDSLKFKEILINYQIHTIYHAAAYKHVPLVEMNPMEGIKNNIVGTYNCVKGALDAAVDTFILISTDKAVSPLNTYGATKLLMEKLLTTAQNYLDVGKYRTKFLALRYGNVFGSSGSVVPKFIKQIQAKEKITITDPGMTRFSMTMDEALDFILESTSIAKGTEVFIPKLKAYSINDLKNSLFELIGNTGEKIISLRPGEKMHEVLINFDEMRYTWEIDNKYVLFNSAKKDDDIKRNYSNIKRIQNLKKYSSDMTERISLDDLKKIIIKSGFLEKQ